LKASGFQDVTNMIDAVVLAAAVAGKIHAAEHAGSRIVQQPRESPTRGRIRSAGNAGKSQLIDR
jgi:hypothetical protein